MTARQIAIALTIVGVANLAAAEPAADVMQAHALLGRWIDAQNQQRFDDYAALYSDDFQGTKVTAKGASSTLNAAQWKADRAKMFKSKNLHVETFAEQYGREHDGSMVVVFWQIYRSGSYSDQGRKLLVMAQRDGQLKIVIEKIADVEPVESGSRAGTGGDQNVASVFPTGFADPSTFLLWPCKKGVCDATLTLGKSKLTLGKMDSDAEGEDTGSSAYVVRAFAYQKAALLDGAQLVTVDEIDKSNDASLFDRLAAVVTKGPDYRVMWSGKIKGCRTSVVPDQKTGVRDLVRDCAGKQTVSELK